MKSRYIITLAALCSAWSLAANAGRDVGWEFGGEVIYQNSGRGLRRRIQAFDG